MISFKSNQEELNYWKREAENYKSKYQELQEEYEEFRQGSTELEKELESHVQILEKGNQDLKINNSKLFSEVQNYKRKLESVTTHHKQELSRVTYELTQALSAKENLRNYIRELEQSNDDLERAKREAVVSLEDFEQRLNLAIERNAFLESELDDKDQLAETVQRLKDKAKDLKEELGIKERLLDTADKDTSDHASTSRSHPTFLQDPRQIRRNDNLRPSDVGKKVGKSSTQNSKSDYLDTCNKDNSFSMDIEGEESTVPQICSNTHSFTESPLTPSSRINALNVVSDLIKKVGALENKLASCRTISGFMKMNGAHATRPLLNKDKVTFDTTSPTTPNGIHEPHPITS